MADIDKLNIDSIIQRLLEGEGREGAGRVAVGWVAAGPVPVRRLRAPASGSAGGCAASRPPGGTDKEGAPSRFVLPGARLRRLSPSAPTFPS